MFGKVLKKLIDYSHSKNWFSSLALRGALVMFFFSTLSFSQIEINTVREGFYKVFDTDSIQIDQKATELEAMQGLINYQFRTDKKGYYLPPNFRVDIKGNTSLKEIDTIKIYRRIDVDGLPVRAFRDKVIDDNYYVLFINEGMIMFKADSLPYLKIDYTFKRTREFGKSSYDLLKVIDTVPPAMGTIISIEIE